MIQQPPPVDVVPSTDVEALCADAVMLCDSANAQTLPAADSAALQAFRECYPYVAKKDAGGKESVLWQPISCFDTLWAARPSNVGATATDSAAQSETLWHVSPFEGHALQPSHLGLEMRNASPANGWFIGGLMVLTVLLCVFFRSHRLSLSNVSPALFNSQQFEHLQREKGLIKWSKFLPTTFLCAATLAIAVYSMPLDFSFGGVGQRLALMGSLMAGISLLFLLHDGMARLLGNIFGNASAATTYVLTGQLYQMALSVCLIPLLLVVLCLKVSPAIHIAFVIIPIAFFWLLNLVRGVAVVAKNRNTTNLFLIYYLCILEIVPVVVVAKVLISM